MATTGGHKEQQELAEAKRQQLDHDINAMLDTGPGKRYLWSLMAFCNTFHDCFTGNSATYYNEGRRSVGLKIFDDIMKFAPDAFVKMQKEFNLNNKE